MRVPSPFDLTQIEPLCRDGNREPASLLSLGIDNGDPVQPEVLELDGIYYVPSSYHVAAQSRRLVRFLEPLDEALKVPATKVDGCASQVWLHPQINDGVFRFDGESDALIVRGLIAVLRALSGPCGWAACG